MEDEGVDGAHVDSHAPPACLACLFFGLQGGVCETLGPRPPEATPERELPVTQAA